MQQHSMDNLSTWFGWVWLKRTSKQVASDEKTSQEETAVVYMFVKNFEQWQWPKTGLHKSHPNLWPRLTNIPYFSSLYLSFANVVINSDLHTMFAATLFTMGTGKFQAASYLTAMVKRCPLKINLQIIYFCTWHRRKESWLAPTHMTVIGLGYSIGLSKIV